MPDLPSLTIDDVGAIVPNATEIEAPRNGGQKVVFPCKIKGEKWALKFMLVKLDADGEEDSLNEVVARAEREVDTIKSCTSPYIVKLGPISLKTAIHKDQT